MQTRTIQVKLTFVVHPEGNGVSCYVGENLCVNYQRQSNKVVATKTSRLCISYKYIYLSKYSIVEQQYSCSNLVMGY